MHTLSEIKNTARRIYNEGYDLRIYENTFRRQIEEVPLWWCGYAAKSFAQGYREVEYAIKRLYTGLNDLENGLHRLASEVQRADDERRQRRIEVENRRREQMKY